MRKQEKEARHGGVGVYLKNILASGTLAYMKK